MIGHCELLCKWLNTHRKTIKITSLNGQSQERVLDYGDSTERLGCSVSLSLALFWNPMHSWPADETLTWQKESFLLFPNYRSNAYGVQEFCKICTWENLFLKMRDSNVFHRSDICCNKCDSSQKFLHNEKRQQMQEKQVLDTPQVLPQSTLAVNPSDSFNIGEFFFHLRGVLSQYSWNWKVDSRPLKLPLFLPHSLAFSLPSLFLTLVLFFLRGHEGSSQAWEHWSEPDLDLIPPLPTP